MVDFLCAKPGRSTQPMWADFLANGMGGTQLRVYVSQTGKYHYFLPFVANWFSSGGALNTLAS